MSSEGNGPGARLDALTAHDAEIVRGWRNTGTVRSGLRTPVLLTATRQGAWYESLHDDRAPHRYWAVRRGPRFVAMVGLVGIQWENGLAEIALITDPAATRQGNGSAGVGLVLGEAFGRMRLATVFGECYECNPAVEFWRKIAERYGAQTATLPRRKFWAERLWDSFYFSIAPEGVP